MPVIPPCTAAGDHCVRLAVTLRVATSDTDDISGADHEATWLLGHTERIAFGPLRQEELALVAPAVLEVPCRYATIQKDSVRCAVYGFEAQSTPAPRAETRQRGENRFEIVEGGRTVTAELEPPRPTGLPVLASSNPCATARCATADHRIGAACCRDLQIEIVCQRGETLLEALVRSRKSPYLCKVSRESADTLGAEMISACSYLEAGGVVCTLHGRLRSDGRSAKPDLCFHWPTAKDNHHTRCVFTPGVVERNITTDKDLHIGTSRRS
jgi:hypothetical protein